MHGIRTTRPPDKAVAALALLVGLAFAGWMAIMADWAAVGLLELEQLFFGLFMLLWVAAPYFVVAATALFVSTSWAARGLLLLLTPAMAANGIRSFDLIDEDAQGALILLFVPFFQLGAAVLTFVLVLAMEWGLRRKER